MSLTDYNTVFFLKTYLLKFESVLSSVILLHMSVFAQPYGHLVTWPTIHDSKG